ncbi:hypothetical protein BST14_04315 [Mycobacterium arosiense ATCC BAA-1401 = DSM 45069]|uniref:Uncharacterized protein n=1 Tax=Mycobacterium arosiense ATCC BAA-1401 = DSM 45069 TaxID=1265311 RepID=A0A1W9ZP70_MYCAI|nr:hypothetical protein BST14_04315 [Mycobacterium arosiense ATCC BAA-1401 = DSM 45069]
MPLSHVYGLEWLIATLSSGGIGYFAAKSDMSTLFDDIGLVGPTALNLVPRVCDMFFRRYRRELDQRFGGELSGKQLDEAVKAELRQEMPGPRRRPDRRTPAHRSRDRQRRRRIVRALPAIGRPAPAGARR